MKANDKPVELFKQGSELESIIDKKTKVKNSTNQLINSEIFETIEKMNNDVKMLFFKISDQLNDPSHPLTRICTKF